MEKRKSGAMSAGVVRLLRGIAAIAAAMVIVLALTVFFRVMSVEIEGSELIGAEEFCETAGIEIGQNLLSVNKNEAASRICAEYVDIESVRILRKLPNRLVVSITERVPIAYVCVAGKRWVIDCTGFVMRDVELNKTEGLIRLDGLKVETPEAGKRLTAADGKERYLDYALSLLELIHRLNMDGDVDEIDASDITSFTMEYLGRFTVQLGSNSELEYKFSALSQITDTLGRTEKGTIDVSGGSEKRKYFRPE